MKYLITSLILLAISVWVVAISPSPIHDANDIVASMRDNVYESITLKLGDGCTVDEFEDLFHELKRFHYKNEILAIRKNALK